MNQKEKERLATMLGVTLGSFLGVKYLQLAGRRLGLNPAYRDAYVVTGALGYIFYLAAYQAGAAKRQLEKIYG